MWVTYLNQKRYIPLIKLTTFIFKMILHFQPFFVTIYICTTLFGICFPCFHLARLIVLTVLDDPNIFFPLIVGFRAAFEYHWCRTRLLYNMTSWGTFCFFGFFFFCFFFLVIKEAMLLWVALCVCLFRNNGNFSSVQKIVHGFVLDLVATWFEGICWQSNDIILAI
jgi:hypothetical protein